MDAVRNYLSKTDSGNTYAPIDAAYTKNDTDTKYLAKTDAVRKYLTKTDADRKYATKVSSGTHLTRANAATVYLSKNEAASTYIDQFVFNTLVAPYMKTVDADGKYLSKREAASTYETKDTLRLTFTANGKTLANFLFYNSIIMVFTKVLKYIKQLLNLWYVAII